MRAALKLIPFIFATAMSLVVFVFPEPEDFFTAFSFQPEYAPMPTGHADNAAITDWRSATTELPNYTFDDFERMGCPEVIEKNDRSKLQACAEVIAAAVIQVTQYEHRIGAKTTTAERLMLAATHVCRADWANSPSLAIDLSNPACATSTLRLASLN